MSTIFDNVVTKENDHTQLLRNIMERDPKAAKAVLSYLINRDVPEVEAASLEFRTQCLFLGVNGREIPDILVDGSGFRCLIEAKVDPTLELTDPQKAGYQACLEGDGERHLAFLVPSDWKHTASAEQVQKLVPSNVRVHTSYWRELIERLDTISVPLADDVLIEAIRFWKWRFQLEQMTTQERESLDSWSAERYSAVRKLEKTISQAKGLFDARGFETELETSYTDSYGFYIKQAPKYLLWIGIWTPAQVPLSFGFHVNSRRWLRPANHPSAPINVQNHLMWPLESETWDNPEKLYAKVKSFLDTYPTPSN
jgi:hypothetical protein